MLPITLPSNAERSRIFAVRELRRRKLEHLYERRAIVDVLIRCLEEYQRCQTNTCLGAVGTTGTLRLMSGFAQSRI